MKVARLSALRTGHLYPQESSLVLIAVSVSVDPRGTVALEGIEPATLWLVTQCLNQSRNSVPLDEVRGVRYEDSTTNTMLMRAEHHQQDT